MQYQASIGAWYHKFIICEPFDLNDQMRAGKLWTQIEATFKQMDTAGTELECFQALQKQEQLAASHRINGLWEEVQKQKELEQTLQSRYGDLIAEQERIQSLINEYRVQAKIQEEIAAKNHALELAEAETCQMDVENPEPAAADELGNSVQVDPSHGGLPDQKMDSSQEEYHTSPKHDADADADAANHITVAGLETPDAVAASDVLGNSFPADPSHDEMPGQKLDAAEGEAHASPNPDVNVGAENETIVPDTETAEPVCPSDELGKSMPVGSSRDGTPNDQMGAVQAEAYASTKLDGDVGAEAQDGGGS